MSVEVFTHIIEEYFFASLKLRLFKTQSLLLVCLTVWCGTFLFLAFSPKDVCLIGLLLIAAGAYFIGNEWQGTDVATLFFGITLSRGTGFALKARSQESEVRSFFVCLILLLAFASWWHLDMSDNFYHGPRWMGLWNDPNEYGVLMGAGLLLAVGLLAGIRSSEFGVRNYTGLLNVGSYKDFFLLRRG